MTSKDFDEYLHALFYPDEAVFVADDLTIDRATFVQPERDGCYVGCNPYKIGEERRSPVYPRLVAFRNFVIEFDDMPLSDQYILIKSLNIPYATIVYSGNKSYHCVVALKEDIGYTKYREYAARIKRVLPDCDKNCLEPSRTTRAPKGVQTLISIHGKVDEEVLDQWLKSIEVTLPPLPEPRKDKGDIKTGVMYPKTLKVLAGEINPENVHGDFVAAVRNLIEMGFTHEKCMKLLGDARQINMKGRESPEYSKQRVKKIVDWAFNIWVNNEN